MAITIPDSIRSSATAGERLLFRTLKNYLPDDYIVYYEPEIQGRRPDFVIIGPDLGIVILEVKDYTKNTLLQLNHEEWHLVTSTGETAIVKSPMKQARENMFHVVDVLKKDKLLVQLDGKYKFQLKFPYGHGVVFTRLLSRDMVQDGLYSVIEPSLSLTRDEIDPEKEEFSEEVLMEKILNMFIVPYRLKEPLTHEDINSIRYHLFPEVRISAEFKAPVPYQDQLLLSLHDVKTMDIHQENLAKQIGDKNRLIRGVAGSGKTIILASRAKMLLKQNPDWKILILCYNISLANAIHQMVTHMLNEPEDLFDFDFSGNTADKVVQNQNIQVRNFHSWLKNDLKIREQQIPDMIGKLESNEAILPTYDAILIDEGQDFEADWLKLVSLLIDEKTQSLLLVEDRAQSIYKRKRSYLQDTGLSFQGRSKVLSINYRNTAQIVKFAWDFYRKHSLFKNKVVNREIEGEIIAPQSTKRKGPEPAIVKAKSFYDEMRLVSRQIKNLHEEKKVPLHEMLILYRVKRTHKQPIIDVIQRSLKDQNIPYFWITENDGSKRTFEKEDGRVKISTIDSSKGLDFQAVFIVNVDSMPFPLEEDKEREVSLLYIGMTRAKQYLCLSYSGESEYTRYLDGIVAERKEEKQGVNQVN
ncbi:MULTISPECIES: nuclease-related domain-containing DEAD/DEAH box helicase [unclassified Bacillus (in: firmicutes)]|uniref:3'-5' exonuclease n=1 Tax=unclassified Bacillus (in: firmicutes) TaxID=185979 RepID=UPI0008F387AC|nr:MULTISPECIES: nuclease-related domain-containing DEAD/DEAH box helicase [unclassified Bacillus (in: firmicutes)]SFA86575.1 UvrD-like helicase C-terminal domain-containing protein [Bacillus sp. UNCCL13]SFQ83751.1 UvrD-like helicase C-terminal domain-containing protein [Bacillus sp. cl95]